MAPNIFHSSLFFFSLPCPLLVTLFFVSSALSSSPFSSVFALAVLPFSSLSLPFSSLPLPFLYHLFLSPAFSSSLFPSFISAFALSSSAFPSSQPWSLIITFFFLCLCPDLSSPFPSSLPWSLVITFFFLSLCMPWSSIDSFLLFSFIVVPISLLFHTATMAISEQLLVMVIDRQGQDLGKICITLL